MPAPKRPPALPQRPRRAAALPACTRRHALLAAGLACTGLARAGDQTTVHELHGLARITLPAAWRLRGLDTRDRSLPPAAQLQRHPGGPLVFEFEAEPRNSWGGHALQPLLLNLVLFDPAAPGPRPERGFSIARYHSPTGGTIALDDARWQQHEDGTGAGRRTWRWLAMDDHFGAPPEPRWAVSVHAPALALRLDLFAWRRRLDRAQAEALLRDALAGLQLLPARAAFFAQPGTPQERQAQLRARQVAQFFGTLAPLGLAPAAPGAVSLAPGAAAWQDSDGQALRALVLLATPPASLVAGHDAQGRPRLAQAATPALQPPPRPAELLYWHAPGGHWRKTVLGVDRSPADWPLLPIEAAHTARLTDRSRLQLVLSFHAYQPPVLDDVADLPGFLADVARWRAVLRAGLLPGLEAAAVAEGPLR